GSNCSEAVNEHAVPSVSPTCAFPMCNHSRLREREGKKSADGKERNQMIRHASESSQQGGGENRQGIDSMRINQPPSARGERIRQISVLGNGAADLGETGERRVGLKHQDHQNRNDSDVVKPV